MADAAKISANDLFSGDPNEIFVDAGVPKYNRRLTDKILAAFNHAYSSGEGDLARDLWECLAYAEKRGAEQFKRRRPNQGLELAALWMAFVDARNNYRKLSDDAGADEDETSRAFRSMKQAYLSWIWHLRQS